MVGSRKACTHCTKLKTYKLTIAAILTLLAGALLTAVMVTEVNTRSSYDIDIASVDLTNAMNRVEWADGAADLAERQKKVREADQEWERAVSRSERAVKVTAIVGSLATLAAATYVGSLAVRAHTAAAK